jgi:hypothetical protein
MSSWPSPANFFAPRQHAQALIGVFAAMALATSTALKPKEPALPHKAFKSYEPGFIHIDFKYLPKIPDETSRRYLFVGIDRATCWVFVQIKNHKWTAAAGSFLNALHKACPIKIQKS